MDRTERNRTFWDGTSPSSSSIWWLRTESPTARPSDHKIPVLCLCLEHGWGWHCLWKLSVLNLSLSLLSMRKSTSPSQNFLLYFCSSAGFFSRKGWKMFWLGNPTTVPTSTGLIHFAEQFRCTVNWFIWWDINLFTLHAHLPSRDTHTPQREVFEAVTAPSVVLQAHVHWEWLIQGAKLILVQNKPIYCIP